MLKLVAGLLDSSNRALEAHLALFFLFGLALIAFTALDILVNHQHFDSQGFGVAAAAIFAGCGANAWGQGLQRRLEGRTRSRPPIAKETS